MANKVNLGNAIISNSPGTGGTTFEVSGYGDVMPVANFYATATPAGQLSTMGNSEIVLVTAKSTDNLTVTRAQKGTTAQDVDAGWILSNGVYVEDLDEKADESDLTAHTSNTSNPHSVTKAQVGLGNVTNDAQLKIASNLSDLGNTTTARTNLGLGSLAIKSSVDIADINATGGTSTSFLRKDGTWQTPTNTTYTEISTAEIDAGTASTLRTITGRRVQYIKDWVTAAIATMKASLTKTDVGLGNVDNTSDATKNSATATLTNKTISASSNTITGLFWDELGRVTLGSTASSLSVASLPQRKYLKIIATIIPTGGSFDPKLRLNNDSGNNYSMAILYDGGASATYSLQTSKSFVQLSSTIYTGGIGVIEATILNVASLNKVVAGTMSQDGTSAAATQAPILEYANGKWVSGAIVNRIDIIKSAGTGSLAAGSELIILGHD